MKNNFCTYLFILFFCCFSQNSYGKEFFVNASKVEFDKDKKIVYAEGNVEIKDRINNSIFSEQAEYDKINGIVKTIGPTTVVTSENYIIEGQDIFYDDNKKIIYSAYDTTIQDIVGNKIAVQMFNYLTLKNMFFSKGDIKVTDNRSNEYLFSEIYIDEKNKKMVGSDIKSFINDVSFKDDQRNEPRFYGNSATISEENTIIEKGVFTSCKIREGKKCPPWVIRAEKIEHSKAKKTIYYHNAVMKIYDFPVFYFPKFFHPDPTVKRQSGFLVPQFSDNSMVGFGATIPYFWAMSKDRDMTITPKLYANENIIIMNEYRQAFDNAFLIVDSSYTEGYKKKNNTRLPGGRTHLFAKLNVNFSENEDYINDLEINIERVSNPTYFEVHEINTTLVDMDKTVLENNIKYEFQDEKNSFGLVASLYEDLKKTDRTRYEYIIPEASFSRNVFADEKMGLVDLFSNAYVKNVDVDQTTKMWVNDFNWKSRPFRNFKGVQSEFEGIFKVTNYEADAERYKTDGLITQASGALAYNASLPLTKTGIKKDKVNFLTPKMSVRSAPGHMRNIQDDDLKLAYSNLFSLNKNSQGDVVEKGTSVTLGLELSNNDLNDNVPGEKNYSLAIGQVYNIEENQDIPLRSSLHQKTSDLVGKGYIKLSENLKITNEFSFDHNFSDINYNDIEANLILGNADFNLKYLEENNHIGSTNYIKSDLKLTLNDSNALKFDIRRNLETESTEFYSLAYDYLNDCLRAGLVFRRQFYKDRDIESADSLMFQISLVPLGNILSPKVK
tara:strand:+ start:2150 stop:4492 length:2343 start_codon:yes stop_codon:yes gene_type:complete